MQNLDTPKKPAAGDWPSHYIVYRLRERGTSLRRLAVRKGFAATSASTAIQVPWPKMERLIADAIGVRPDEIWPSRYNADGTPKSRRDQRGLGRYKPKHSTTPRRRTIQRPSAV
jgi:Ner family transcriptional regulator